MSGTTSIMDQATHNNVTIIISLLMILVNVCIAKYNVGKNRKIYKIIPIKDATGEDVNNILNSGNYTILHVSPCNEYLGSNTYVLGKLDSKDKQNITIRPTGPDHAPNGTSVVL